jgi:hypothetical protein
VCGHAAQDEQIRQDIDHVRRFQLAGHPDGQAFAGEFIDDVDHRELAAVMGAVLDEVVGPDVVWPLKVTRTTDKS